MPAEKQVADADLFTGTSVTLPAPANKLKLGMSEADAKAAAPELFAAKYGYEIPGTKINYSSAKIVVQVERGKVWNIRVELHDSQDAAKAWLSKKWGEPVAQKNSIGTPEYYWIAPAAHMRAKLEQAASKSILYFSEILPVAELLGSDPKHFAFEPTPFIGMSKDDAQKALAAYDPQPRKDDPDVIFASFPPTETAYSGAGSSISLRVKKDKVTGYTFDFITGDPKDVDLFAAKLESMFGKGKPDATKLYTDYPAASKAKAEIKTTPDARVILWVGDYRK